MEIGDIYTKHVRGSRYIFNHDGIYYSHPSGQRSWWKNPNKEILSRLLKLKESGGRVYINEKKEMVIYKEFLEEKKYKVWKPVYAGIFEGEMTFDEISINPKGLSHGLLWPGFNSKHGSRFSIDNRGKVFFKEVSFKKHGVKTKTYYPVKMEDNVILNRIRTYKHNGTFFLNEYGHVWTPVEREYFEKQKESNPDFYEKINNQWKLMYRKTKNTIDHYIRMHEKMYIPIYAGKYEGEMKVIGREEHPRIVYDWKDLDEL
jgi:hypothetical protein